MTLERWKEGMGTCGLWLEGIENRMDVNLVRAVLEETFVNIGK